MWGNDINKLKQFHKHVYSPGLVSLQESSGPKLWTFATACMVLHGR